MDGNAEFIAWLREEAARGTELFLHGYYHWMGELAEGDRFRGRRDAWGRFVNRRLVDREAEFSGLRRIDQARILAAGLEVWRRTGLPLSGFVAPTWHGSPAETGLREAGIPLWETRFRLSHLPTSRTRFVPPLAWNLATPTGEPALFGGRAWLAAMLRIPLMKVALHPGDFEGRGTERALERVFAVGSNVGYAELFEDLTPPGAPARGFSNAESVSAP
jgi:predicted deacetylase